MILVIVGHCSYYSFAVTTYGGISYLGEDDERCQAFKLIAYAVGFIYYFHMPLFMFISGLCFSLGKGRPVGFVSFAKKKARRLLVPFLLTTTFLSVPLKYFTGYWSESANVLRDVFLGQYLAMGNTHLWFVMALFGIMLVAFAIERLRIKKGFLFWAALLVASWVGQKASIALPWSMFLCAAKVLQYLVYFELGVCCMPKLKEVEVSSPALAASFVGMGLFFILRLKADSLGIPGIVNNYPLATVAALWGTFNMVFLSKKIYAATRLAVNPLYQAFSRNSYELYLFSDPFNYVIIALLIGVWGSGVFTVGALSVALFAIRLFGTSALAFLVVWMVGVVRSRFLRPLFKL